MSLTFQDFRDFLVFSSCHIPNIRCCEYQAGEITSTILGSDEGKKTDRKVFHGKNCLVKNEAFKDLLPHVPKFLASLAGRQIKLRLL